MAPPMSKNAWLGWNRQHSRINGTKDDLPIGIMVSKCEKQQRIMSLLPFGGRKNNAAAGDQRKVAKMRFEENEKVWKQKFEEVKRFGEGGIVCRNNMWLRQCSRLAETYSIVRLRTTHPRRRDVWNWYRVYLTPALFVLCTIASSDNSLHITTKTKSSSCLLKMREN